MKWALDDLFGHFSEVLVPAIGIGIVLLFVYLFVIRRRKMK